MKNSIPDINLPELVKKFSGRGYASRKDLRNFYLHLYPNLTEQDFRRILYSLKKQDYIGSSGSGVYVFQTPFSPQYPVKKKFVPTLSPRVKIINGEIEETFPYLVYLVWETKILHEFMVHQPGQNQIILETEKGTEDSVFDHLTEIYPAQTFLDPDRITIQRYAFQQPESIIISKLVTQTPMGKRVDGVPYAKLEKIMVDILVDDDRYFLFQGQELASIYENAFAHYLIDEKSMTRYARRRNAVPKLKKFLLNHPRIRFMQFSLDIK